MAILLDMSKAGREPLPEGNYVLRVNEVTVEDNKAKDGQYLKFKYVVVEPSEFSGRFVWDNSSLKAAGLWRTQQVLETLTGKPWRDAGLELDPNDLVGLMVKAVIYQDEYNNKVNNKIQDLFPYTDSGFVESDDDEDEPF